MAIRAILNEKPWIGWVAAAIFFGAAVFSVIWNATNRAPDSVERLSEVVTIRCTETGEEWQMIRGQFERMLLTHPGQIDPAQGIPSKFADGRLTGVLVGKDEWEDTVERINAMKRTYGQD